MGDTRILCSTKIAHHRGLLQSRPLITNKVDTSSLTLTDDALSTKLGSPVCAEAFGSTNSRMQHVAVMVRHELCIPNLRELSNQPEPDVPPQNAGTTTIVNFVGAC